MSNKIIFSDESNQLRERLQEAYLGGEQIKQIRKKILNPNIVFKSMCYLTVCKTKFKSMNSRWVEDSNLILGNINYQNWFKEKSKI